DCNQHTCLTVCVMIGVMISSLSFFSNDTPTTEIYTLSLHDALPIFDPEDPVARLDAGARRGRALDRRDHDEILVALLLLDLDAEDRKSTRLNSSHRTISYAVFCLKKKKKVNINTSLYEFTYFYHRVF